MDVLSRFRIAGPIEERRDFAYFGVRPFVRSADSESERRGEEKAAESSAHAAVREPRAQPASAAGAGEESDDNNNNTVGGVIGDRTGAKTDGGEKVLSDSCVFISS